MAGTIIILKKEEDFKKFRQSKAFASQFLKLRIKAGNQNTPRFGFIIPKKVISKVTARNKIKRRIKSILHQHLSSIKSLDVLIFPSAQIQKLKFKDLEQQTINLLRKANLWKT
jgi:ribonuclease P protein component